MWGLVGLVLEISAQTYQTYYLRTVRYGEFHRFVVESQEETLFMFI